MSEAPPERSFMSEAPPERSFSSEAPPERPLGRDAPPARRLAHLGACVALLMALASCAYRNPDYDPSRPHHRPDGFVNTVPTAAPAGFANFLRWQIDRRRQGLPPPPGRPTPVVKPDLAFVRGNAVAGVSQVPAVTWIGHATVLLQMAGLNILTDPQFSERAFPVQWAGPRRHQPPGMALADLPRIDLVVISHNHYDHLDEASVRALAAQAGGPPLFVVPLGVRRWFTDIGIAHARQLDWWQSLQVGGVEVHLVPAQHWSARGFFDRRQTLWGGFALVSPTFRAYYAGDTGYGPDFQEIGRRFAGGFDLALIPIGAYTPRWFMANQHVDPDEALRIHQDVGARRSLGVHWGTFVMADEPLEQPPIDLAVARTARGIDESAFFTLAIGETRRLPAISDR